MKKVLQFFRPTVDSIMFSMELEAVKHTNVPTCMNLSSLNIHVSRLTAREANSHSEQNNNHLSN